ncbi:hypothetical protein AB0939_07605 [Streptomyces sp. NPDC006990]|uniref:hypothetical protein n=1 Tax=Streptomyces sp. NPDC006990 TaxID=3154481 RepID=UPI003455EFE4
MRFEKSTRAEHAYLQLDGEAARAPAQWRAPLGKHPALIWLLVAAGFLVAAGLSLATGIEARDTAAVDGEAARRPPVRCGSVLSPARWSTDTWDDNAVRWHTRVCDTARITRLGWTGIFGTGGMTMLIVAVGVGTRRRTGSAPGPGSP